MPNFVKKKKNAFISCPIDKNLIKTVFGVTEF